MLQTFRDHFPKWLTFLLIGLLIFLFAWTSFYSENSNPSHNSILLRVNKHAIYYETFQHRYEKLIQQVETQQSTELSAEHKTNLKQQLLLQLVIEALLTQRITQYGLRLHESDLVSSLKQISEFQVKGIFSSEKFYTVIRDFGHTESSFLLVLKDALLRNQIQSSVLSTAFVLPEEFNRILDLQNQTRDFNYTIITNDTIAQELVQVLQKYPNTLPKQIQNTSLDWHQIKQAKLTENSTSSENSIPFVILNTVFQLSKSLTNKPVLTLRLTTGDYAVIQLITVHYKKTTQLGEKQAHLSRKELEFKLAQQDYALYTQSALHDAKIA